MLPHQSILLKRMRRTRAATRAAARGETSRSGAREQGWMTSLHLGEYTLRARAMKEVMRCREDVNCVP
eukprot:1159521-Pelagomonas_calceolata.AAC.7